MANNPAVTNAANITELMAAVCIDDQLRPVFLATAGADTTTSLHTLGHVLPEEVEDAIRGMNIPASGSATTPTPLSLAQKGCGSGVIQGGS